MENNESIGKSWWKLLLRGIFALLFGLLAFTMPGLTVWTLALLFGLFVLADGIVEIGYAFASQNWWMLIPGILGIVVGVFSIFFLPVTAFALLIIIGAWAVARGILDIAGAIQLHKKINGEWLMILSGILSIIVGLALTVFPSDAAVAMVWVIGAYAFVLGLIMIVAAFRVQRSGTEIPTVSHP